MLPAGTTCCNEVLYDRIASLLSKHPVTRDVPDPYTINQTMERLTSVIHPSVPWKTSSKITKEDETDTSIAATLERARAQRRAARFQLTVVPVTVGLSFCIVLIFANLSGALFVHWLLPLSSVAVTFAILPSDKIAIKSVYIIFMVVVVIISSLYIVGGLFALNEIDDKQCNAAHISVSLDEEERVHCGWAVLIQIRQLAIAVAYFFFIFKMLMFYRTIKDSGPLLDKFTAVLGYIFSTTTVVSVLNVVALIGIGADAMYIIDRVLYVISCSVASLILNYPGRLRTLVRTFLLSRIEHGTAVSVAGFLGGKSSEHIHSTAKRLFRGVTLDMVEKEAMASSTPDPLLLEKTVPAMLGQVDAFLSHSWHDDSELKWEQLQIYREEFKQANGGREPLIWIDKYCLDQNNLTDGLMCLPVFLAGCNSLLVLAGTTYSRRLWCVMELFIFLIMGGSETAVDVRLLCNNLDTAEREALIQDLESFDAKQAKCSVQDDEDRMLGAIAGAFGSLEAFSKDVRKTLGSILRRGGSQLEQEVVQLRGRILELEKANAAERLTQLERRCAEQARVIEEQARVIEEVLKQRGGG